MNELANTLIEMQLCLQTEETRVGVQSWCKISKGVCFQMKSLKFN